MFHTGPGKVVIHRLSCAEWFSREKAEDVLKGHVLWSATQLQAVLASLLPLHFATSFSCHVSFGGKAREDTDVNYQKKKRFWASKANEGGFMA